MLDKKKPLTIKIKQGHIVFASEESYKGIFRAIIYIIM